jgi:hypothetical protein
MEEGHRPEGDIMTTPKPETPELLPCPFCGSEAYTFLSPELKHGTAYVSKCKNPLCDVAIYSLSLETPRLAAEAWNRRAPDTSAELLACLKECRSFMVRNPAVGVDAIVEWRDIGKPIWERAGAAVAKAEGRGE